MWFRRRRHKADVATPHRTVEVLDGGARAVVVHLADRAFPGVVLQGDALWCLRDGIDRIAARAQRIQDDGLLQDARRLQAFLHPVFDDYNEACKRHGRGGF